MPKIRIDFEKCKGCELCTTVCPKKILEIGKEKRNRKGYFSVVCNDDEKCIACAMCATICPDCVIEVG